MSGKLSAKIRAGIAGVAGHGSTILHALSMEKRLTLAACHDVDAQAAAEAARQYGCRVAESYEALAQDEQIDALFLITPNHLHETEAVLALREGKDIFVEKPMALDAAECRRIIDAARRGDRIVMVGHNTRRRPVFRAAKKLLEEGTIGSVIACHAHMSFDFGLGPRVPEWKTDERKCPLLPMTQLGIHFIDTLQFLVGPIRRVGTLARSAVLRRGGDRPVVDSTVAILELESGVIATMQSHYVVAPVYILVLHGVDGSLTCREDRIDVVRRAEGEYLSWSLPTPERDGESFTSEVAEFIDCLVARRQPETGAEVGYRNVALLDAMRRSVEEGRFVHIDEIISS